MLRNYFLINLVLVIIILFLGYSLYSAVTRPLEMPSAPAAEGEAGKEAGTGRPVEKPLNENSFRIISRMDIFRPSRSAPALELKKTPEVFVSKGTPRLFGTVILDNDKTAILEDPDTKKTKAYRINESVAGFVIADIMKNRVVLLRNGEKVEVKLREDKGIRPPRRPAYNRPPRRQQRRMQKRNPPPPQPPLPPGELPRKRGMVEGVDEGKYAAN
ncbi:MAG: hypothetical protein GXP46_06890 [Deferribacteres bacterium]|nr:hypothetical protein [Deferribacteres bacterium]